MVSLFNFPTIIVVYLGQTETHVHIVLESKLFTNLKIKYNLNSKKIGLQSNQSDKEGSYLLNPSDQTLIALCSVYAVVDRFWKIGCHNLCPEDETNKLMQIPEQDGVIIIRLKLL